MRARWLQALDLFLRVGLGLERLHRPALLDGELARRDTEFKELANDGGEAASDTEGIVVSRMYAGAEHLEHKDLLLEESLLVLGVNLGGLAERLVLDEGHVGREHHERLGRLVGVLLGTLPVAPDPRLLDEQAEILVRLRGRQGKSTPATRHDRLRPRLAHHGGRREVPRSVKARAVGVAAAEGVTEREKRPRGSVDQRPPAIGPCDAARTHAPDRATISWSLKPMR